MSIFSPLRYLDQKFSWSFFGFLLAVLFGTLTIYDRFIADKHPKLYFDVLTSTTVLDIKENLPKLEILFDGLNIREQNLSLRVLSIKVVNDSSKDILKGDYDPDDPIGFHIEGGKIIRSDIAGTSNEYLSKNLSIFSPSNELVHFKDVILEAHQFFVIKLLVLHPAGRSPTVSPVGHIAGVKDILVREPYRELGRVSVWEGAFAGSWVVQLVRVVAYFLIAIAVILAITIPSLFLSDKLDEHRRMRAVKEFKATTSFELKKADEFIFRSYIAGGQSAMAYLQALTESHQTLAYELRTRERLTKHGGKHPAFEAGVDQRELVMYHFIPLLDKCIDAGFVRINGEAATIDPHGRACLDDFVRFLKNKGLFSEKSSRPVVIRTSDERGWRSPDDDRPSAAHADLELLPEMEDYSIKRTEGGEFVISAQTERAQNRTPGGIREGHALAFKSRTEIVEYVKANEALGFTFRGKELLAP